MKLKNKFIIGGILATATVVFGYTPPSKVTYPPPGYGVVNPDINQGNITQTICNPKWFTKTIRPAESYTNKLKLEQMKILGYTNPANYEEDHIISLELGGHPTDPHNLLPQSYKTTPGAHEKDLVEGMLHKRVCNGTMSLVAAQKAISSPQWVDIFNQSHQSLGSTDEEISDTDD